MVSDQDETVAPRGTRTGARRMRPSLFCLTIFLPPSIVILPLTPEYVVMGYKSMKLLRSVVGK